MPVKDRRYNLALMRRMPVKDRRYNTAGS